MSGAILYADLICAANAAAIAAATAAATAAAITAATVTAVAACLLCRAVALSLFLLVRQTAEHAPDLAQDPTRRQRAA